MRRLFLVWGCICLGLAIFELGCEPKNKVETCQLTADCAGGKVCKNNLCVGCSTDTECQRSHSICVKELCRFGCRLDADCGGGEKCRQNVCVGPCSVNSDCAANEACNKGKCIAKCITRADCKDPLYCLPSGLCTACLRNEHCTKGFLCLEGECACPKERECEKGICSDLKTDPNHCSICGAVCLHGVCGDGICQFVGSSLSLGGTGTCALAKTGEYRCWGDNKHGALGDGTSNSQKAPIVIAAFKGIRSLSMQGDSGRGEGYASTCGIFQGKVKCWGSNEYGQLGDGSNLSSNDSVTVKDLSGVLMITSGKANWHKGKPAGYFRCALIQADGSVKCWGSSSFGELGNGKLELSTVPVSVIGLKRVSQISGGGSHVCALLTDSSVECWGNNEFGQLGKGDTKSTAGPIDVRGLRTVISISSGVFHSCALLDTGEVWCWGRNDDGQVGNPSKTNQLVPFKVPDVKDAIAVAAGAYHSCALLKSGQVSCWGRNLFGVIGADSIVDEVFPPTILKLGPVSQVAVGQVHTCVVIKSDQTLRCWGQGAQGQLGNRSYDQSGKPSRVVEE